MSSAPEKRPVQSSRLVLRLSRSPKKRPRARIAPTQSVAPMPSKNRKRAKAHAIFAGDGRSEGGEAGDELGDHEGDVAAAAEGVLCFADAGGGLKRELAEDAQDVVAVAAADEEPGAVGCERRGDADERGPRES